MNQTNLERIQDFIELKEEAIVFDNDQITIDDWYKIIELGNIKELFFTGIEFVGEIPDAISKLKHLNKIYFRSCNIKQILFDIRKIKTLSSIIFFNNNITEFPENLAELSNLTTVHIGHEPILKMPIGRKKGQIKIIKS